MARLLEWAFLASLCGVLGVGAGLVLWTNGTLVAEKDIWRREAIASQAERISAERLLGRCEGRRR